MTLSNNTIYNIAKEKKNKLDINLTMHGGSACEKLPTLGRKKPSGI